MHSAIVGSAAWKSVFSSSRSTLPRGRRARPSQADGRRGRRGGRRGRRPGRDRAGTHRPARRARRARRGGRAGTRRDALRDDGAVRAPRHDAAVHGRRARRRDRARRRGSARPEPQRRRRRPRQAPRGRGRRRARRTASSDFARAGSSRRGARGSRTAGRSSPTRSRSRSTAGRPFPARAGSPAKSRAASCTSCAPTRTRSPSGWGRFAGTTRGSTRATFPTPKGQPRRIAFGRGPLPEGSELELRGGPLEEELAALGCRRRAVAPPRGRADACRGVPRARPRGQAPRVRGGSRFRRGRGDGRRSSRPDRAHAAGGARDRRRRPPERATCTNRRGTVRACSPGSCARWAASSRSTALRLVVQSSVDGRHRRLGLGRRHLPDGRAHRRGALTFDVVPETLARTRSSAFGGRGQRRAAAPRGRAARRALRPGPRRRRRTRPVGRGGGRGAARLRRGAARGPPLLRREGLGHGRRRLASPSRRSTTRSRSRSSRTRSRRRRSRLLVPGQGGQPRGGRAREVRRAARPGIRALRATILR